MIERSIYFRCKDSTYMSLATYRSDRAWYLLHMQRYYMPLASYRYDKSMVHISDAKAAEAAQSAYYDPNQPQCAYVPPPAYYVSTAY